jgi:hypothetical protein
MGFESRLRFEVNPADPRGYDPAAFLRSLDTHPPSLICTETGGSHEYRRRGADGAWPDVVVTIEAGGFFLLEYDRNVGTELLGPLVKYALRFAKDERVTIEGV